MALKVKLKAGELIHFEKLFNSSFKAVRYEVFVDIFVRSWLLLA